MKVSLLAGLIVGVAVAMLVLYTAPPIEDFNPLNPYWNGFSDLMSKFHAVELRSLLDENLFLDPSNTSLLIVGPEKEFSEDEAKIIERFLRLGGQVILADDFGSGNQLLELLGINVRFNGSLLVDPLFKERSMRLPRIRAMVLGVRELVFNYGTVLEGCPSPIARSSSYSFLDLDLNTIEDLDRLKIINKNDVVVTTVHRFKYAYVLYDLDYAKNIGIITKYFSEIGIDLMGRFGRWAYLNMDAVVKEVKSYVEEKLKRLF